MTLAALLLALTVGGVAGFGSGLLGIGGGLLMVPFLYFLMGGPAWSGLTVVPDHQATLAHATSLAVIVPTAFSGLLAFQRRNAVLWSSVVPLGLVAAVAAVAGSRLAASVPSSWLEIAFGIFAASVGARFLLRSAEERARSPGTHRMRWGVVVVGGALVGFLSALLGVGGGVIAIPILIHWARMDVHHVAPASIGIIVFAAPAGVLGYVLAGAGTAGLPPGSLGFVHFPTALALAPGAVLLAPVGARWNQRLDAARLRRLFGCLLVGVGLYLIWANAPDLLLR